jgi:hypothetical protein
MSINVGRTTWSAGGIVPVALTITLPTGDSLSSVEVDVEDLTLLDGAYAPSTVGSRTLAWVTRATSGTGKVLFSYVSIVGREETLDVLVNFH